VIHRKLQNVVYMKKSRRGGGQHLKKERKKEKGSNIGSCPQVPVLSPKKLLLV
jgi:hypothetical protein